MFPNTNENPSSNTSNNPTPFNQLPNDETMLHQETPQAKQKFNGDNSSDYTMLESFNSGQVPPPVASGFSSFNNMPPNFPVGQPVMPTYERL